MIICLGDNCFGKRLEEEALVKRRNLRVQLLSPPPAEGQDADFSQWLVQCYAFLHNQIRYKTASDPEFCLIVADIDCFDPPYPNLRTFSPNSDLGGTGLSEAWFTVLAMLTLTHPDAMWVYAGRRESETVGEQLQHHYWDVRDDSCSFPEEFLCLADSGVNSLFDPTGLLRLLLDNAIRHADSSQSYPTVRFQWGVAIDEEEEYAFFHSYALNSLGYGALPVMTRRLFDILFAPNHIPSFGDIEGARNRLRGSDIGRADEERWAGLDISIEDLTLEFPDNPDAETPKRTIFPLLESIPVNLYVTGNPDKTSVKSPTWVEVKPTRGILLLEEKIQEVLLSSVCSPSAKETPSNTGKIRSENTKIGLSEANGLEKRDAVDHSAPGRVQLVARALKGRAIAILEKGATVRDAITAARLAQIAGLLLAGRTPTLALEILALRHKSEVTAEGRFYGVTPDPESEKRYNQIIRETHNIGKYFGGPTRESSVLSAAINIVDEITAAYRANNQFDAELNFLNKSRELRGKRRLADLTANKMKNTAFNGKTRREVHDWFVFSIFLVFSCAVMKTSWFRDYFDYEWGRCLGVILLGAGVCVGMLGLFLCLPDFPLRKLWYKYRDMSLRDLPSLIKSQIGSTFLVFIFYGIYYSNLPLKPFVPTAVHQYDGWDAWIYWAGSYFGMITFNATTAIMSGQSPIESPKLWEMHFLLGPLFGCLAFIIGVVQTGLFMAFLYTRLSRR